MALIKMTHSYLALKNLDSPIKLVKGHQYLMSQKTIEELGIEEMVKKKYLKELSEEEALENYKQSLTK